MINKTDKKHCFSLGMFRKIQVCEDHSALLILQSKNEILRWNRWLIGATVARFRYFRGRHHSNCAKCTGKLFLLNSLIFIVKNEIMQFLSKKCILTIALVPFQPIHFPCERAEFRLAANVWRIWQQWQRPN